jgi:hypothetical protein
MICFLSVLSRIVRIDPYGSEGLHNMGFKTVTLCRARGSHNNGYEDFYIVEYNAVK